MPIHDIRCHDCSYVEVYAFIKLAELEAGDWGKCPTCGSSARCWVPAQLNTDMHDPTYYHATGEFHGSQREATMHLAKQARDWSSKTGMQFVQPIEAGDKVGGARADLSLHDSAWSYPDQKSKKSTGERASARTRGGRKVIDKKVTPAPKTSDYAVSGVEPRRMTKNQVSKERKSPVYQGPVRG